MKRTNKSLKEQVTAKLDEEVAVNEVEREPKKQNLSQVELIDETKIKIENQLYNVVVNYRDAVNDEAIANRYNSILSKYDFIVGDWGYDQLRLKGFFYDKNSRAPLDKKISFLEDYLYEYCNFGCAYFVLEKEFSETKKSRNKRKKKRKNTAHINELREPISESADLKGDKKKNFVIKQADKNSRRTSASKSIKQVTDEKPKTSFQIHKIEE